MCINKEVSFILFIWSLLTAIALFLKNDTAMALFLLGLSLMQLTEFYLHIFKSPKTTLHQIGCVFIFLTLVLQMVFVLIGTTEYQTMFPELFKAIVGLSVVFFVFSIFAFFIIVVPNFGSFDGTPACPNGCKLKWDVAKKIFDFNELFYYVFNLLYLLILFIGIYMFLGIYGVIVVALLLLFSYIFAYNSLGTTWCLMVVFFASAYVVIADNYKDYIVYS